MSRIKTTIEHGYAEIEIDRREKMNALDAAAYRALAAALQQADADPAASAILVRGQEDLFCAGNDLAEFLDPDGEGTRPALALMDAVQSLRKPLVAAVGGPAMGLGTTLLYHCDMVYATPHARFGMPFVPLGVCPEFGTSLLAPMAGHRLAAEAVLFGEVFDVSRAVEMGLVTRIVEESELLSHARSRCSKLATLPQAAVLAAKSMLKKGAFASMPTLFREELAQFDAMLQSAESQQAIRNFLARKTARPVPAA